MMPYNLDSDAKNDAWLNIVAEQRTKTIPQWKQQLKKKIAEQVRKRQDATEVQP